MIYKLLLILFTKEVLSPRLCKIFFLLNTYLFQNLENKTGNTHTCVCVCVCVCVNPLISPLPKGNHHQHFGKYPFNHHHLFLLFHLFLQLFLQIWLSFYHSKSYSLGLNCFFVQFTRHLKQTSISDSQFVHPTMGSLGDFPEGPEAKTPRSYCGGPRFNPWSGN